MDVDEALTRLGGVATTGRLVRATSRGALERAESAGLVVRAGRGRWVLPGLGDAHRAAVRLGGVVSHESAAAHWGLWVKMPPKRPVVTVPRNRHLDPDPGAGASPRTGRPAALRWPGPRTRCR